MKFKFKTIDDREVIFENPYLVNITKEIDTPADSLSATFPILERVPEFKSVEVFISDESIFSGIVDEQITKINADGCFLEIYSRSYAAWLLDNEAMPQVYYSPSLEIIFDRHIKPYGFKKIIGDKSVFTGEFTVTKGMSEWGVLEKFCKTYLNTTPRVTDEFVVDATGKDCEKDKVFIENSKDGICYFEIKENICRYNRISEVFVRAGKDAAYNIKVSNANALGTGIKRKRYLNYTNDSRTPVSCGEEIIKSGEEKFCQFTVELPSLQALEINQQVNISDKILGNISDLHISKIKYILSPNIEKTEAVMFKEEN